LENKLRAELIDQRKALQNEIDAKAAEVAVRAKDIDEREASFNTKESKYVARQKQDEQIKQIQKWLDGWSLTKGTSRKRWLIAGLYISAIVLTGALTAYATIHNYGILKSADDLAKLQWWHWLLLTSKAFFPLAAFTTFMIYFIRWSAAWARQHSDEEFQNRARLIDIGRASWLLEAVRDAQERNKEIPPDLLKEMSRNLFAPASRPDGDIQPETAADILMQGLTSLKVKSPTGTEFEARRDK
jgi:phage gpG-like protein